MKHSVAMKVSIILIMTKKKGIITGYVVSVRDITDMRQMEDKLRQAYKMEAIGTLPIIMITGLNSQTTAEQLKSARIDKLITKPLTTREIATAIRKVLADKKVD